MERKPKDVPDETRNEPLKEPSLRTQQRWRKAAGTANPPGHPYSLLPAENLSWATQKRRRQAAGISNRRGRPLTAADNHNTVKAHLKRSLNETDREQIQNWNFEYRLIVHAVVCDECNKQKAKWRDAVTGDARQQVAEDTGDDNDEAADEVLDIQLANEEATDKSAESLDALLVEFGQAEFKDEGVSIQTIRERFVRDRDKPLGKGANKVVRQCRDLATGTKVAVGELKQPFHEDSEERREFLAEVKMMLDVARRMCPNIVRFICHSIETVDPEAKLQRGWLVSEALEGDLRQCAKLKDGPLETETAKLWLTEIIQAVAWLHENNIMHRDLKWNNIFITKCGHARVGDFGYAKEGQPAADNGLFQTWLGTVGNIAPEIYIGPYTKAADIYAWGMTMLSIFTKKDPYDGEFSKAASKAKLDEKAKEEQRKKEDDYMENKCLAGQRPAGWLEAFNVNGRVEYELAMLYKRCTKFMPASRFEAADLVNHPALMQSNGTHVRRLNRNRFTHFARDEEDEEDSVLLFQVELLEKPGSKPLVIGFKDGTNIRQEVFENRMFDGLRENQKESLVEKLHGYLRISKRESELTKGIYSNKYDAVMDGVLRRYLKKTNTDYQKFIEIEDDIKEDASEPKDLRAARKLVRRLEPQGSKTPVAERTKPGPSKTPTQSELERSARIVCQVLLPEITALADMNARLEQALAYQPLSSPPKSKPKRNAALEFCDALADTSESTTTASRKGSSRRSNAGANQVAVSAGRSSQGTSSSGSISLEQMFSGLSVQKVKSVKTTNNPSGSANSSILQVSSARGAAGVEQRAPTKPKQKSALQQLAS